MNRFNIIDERLLLAMRAVGKCEYCGKFCHVEIHHIFSKGRGNANRFDIPINLVALCQQHHAAYHAGTIERAELLFIVAEREEVTMDWIEREMHRLRREGTNAETQSDSWPSQVGGEPAHHHDDAQERQGGKQGVRGSKPRSSPRDRLPGNPVDPGQWRDL